MVVLSINEQPNGSAIVELEMTKEEQNIFLEIGLVHCLKESLKNFEKELGNNETDLRPSIPE
jgi:hypothetical protein